MTLPTIIAATDGSAINNPNGPAGWGWYITDECWGAGGFSKASNQVAELFAILAVLRAVPSNYPLIIRTDSQFAIDSLTKWMPDWKRRGWLKSDGIAPSNLALVKELDVALQGRTVHFEKVLGHSGDRMNEIADRICGAASKAKRFGTPVAVGPGWTGVPINAVVIPLTPGLSAGSAVGSTRSAKATARRVTPGSKTTSSGKSVRRDTVVGWDDGDWVRKKSTGPSVAATRSRFCDACQGPINPATSECRCSA